jgi:hypothetical protein
MEIHSIGAPFMYDYVSKLSNYEMHDRTYFLIIQNALEDSCQTLENVPWVDLS